MSNKSILQENNAQLSTNNGDLNALLQTITNLPEEDKVQSKSVTITQNGTTIVNPDAGFDTMDKVTITTNVGGLDYEYVQNGLIAWYEFEDNFDSSERLNSRVGNDYIYVYSRPFGNSSSFPASTFDGNLINEGGFVYASSADYYVNGYTIEVVGFLNGRNSGNSNNGADGGWLVTGNCTQTAGIGAQDTTNIMFQNDTGTTPLSTGYTYTKSKPFSASLYLKSNISRGATTRYTTQGSVNGGGYIEQIGSNAGHARQASGNLTLFLSYYTNNYKAIGGIKSIRVYNRQLTNEEMLTNYNIDKARFNLD